MTGQFSFLYMMGVRGDESDLVPGVMCVTNRLVGGEGGRLEQGVKAHPSLFAYVIGQKDGEGTGLQMLVHLPWSSKEHLKK